MAKVTFPASLTNQITPFVSRISGHPSFSIVHYNIAPRPLAALSATYGIEQNDWIKIVNTVQTAMCTSESYLYLELVEVHGDSGQWAAGKRAC